MKNVFNKIVLSIFLLIINAACLDNVDNQLMQNTIATTSKECLSHETLESQLRNNPELALNRQRIEAFVQNYIKQTANNRASATTIKEIPVIINVLYNTAAENISDAKIKAQIDSLTNDFNAKNPSLKKTPALFSKLKATIGYSFRIAKINRKKTTKIIWKVVDKNDNPLDEMKKSINGGIDATDTEHFLNIWVCNMELVWGYTQSPYDLSSMKSTDGIVLHNAVFGVPNVKKVPQSVISHEVGHWMNLIHIWGDSQCGTDFVDDTPEHSAANKDYPKYPTKSKCFGNPVMMTMNFMDLSSERYMFTLGQKERMRAIFAKGGPREKMFN